MAQMENFCIVRCVFVIVFLESVSFLVEGKALQKSSVVKVTVPVPTKSQNKVVESRWPWCKNDVCENHLICDTVVHPFMLCCPTCGCTNQVGMNVEVGTEFAIKRSGKPCYICKCERRYFWEAAFADCMEIKCPYRVELDTCKKKRLPAGSCCEVCDDEDSNSHGGIRPTFPPIPDSLKILYLK